MKPPEKYEPPWGADGWPRVEGELDEGDRLLIQSMLALSPMERLRRLESFVNGLDELRRAEIRTD